MKKGIFFVLSVVTILTGCNQLERELLTSQVDSLRYELTSQMAAVSTLQEVGVLIDSIDASRNLLRANMVEGTSYDNYLARMNDINNYVKESEKKIDELEKSARKSQSVANSYAGTIKKLKDNLAAASQELASLKDLVANYKNENSNLVQTLNLKDAELNDKVELIKVKQQEVATLETRVQDLLIQSKIDQAEAYYERALAIEETANRTKFAPRKKKETQKEALELFKMAFFLGKEEAQPKIAQLEARL
jgi:peptidoglycan hydrolase CwlO-like protein